MNAETRRFLDMNLFKNFSLVHGNLVLGDYEMCFPIEELYAGRIGRKEPVALAVAERTGLLYRAQRARLQRRRGRDAAALPRKTRIPA